MFGRTNSRLVKNGLNTDQWKGRHRASRSDTLWYSLTWISEKEGTEQVGAMIQLNTDQWKGRHGASRSYTLWYSLTRINGVVCRFHSVRYGLTGKHINTEFGYPSPEAQYTSGRFPPPPPPTPDPLPLPVPHVGQKLNLASADQTETVIRCLLRTWNWTVPHENMGVIACIHYYFARDLNINIPIFRVLPWLGLCHNTLTPARTRTPRLWLCHNTLTPARTPRLGLCHNTLTPARTPRLGLCHNTLTPARTPRLGLCHNTLKPARTPRLGLCHNTLTPARTPGLGPYYVQHTEKR